MVKRLPRLAARGWQAIRTEILVLAASLPIWYLLMLYGRLWQLEAPSLDVIVPFLSEGKDGGQVALVVLTGPMRSGGAMDERLVDPGTLRDLVTDIARGGAVAIGVDLDTAAPEYCALRSESFGVPVIWAREGRYSNRQQLFFPAPAVGGEDSSPGVLTGLVTFKTDVDGAIRRYRRVVPTPEGDTPVLPWALVQSLPGFTAIESRFRNEDLFIHYRDNRRSAGRVALPAPLVRDLARGAGWAEGPLRGRVVLLGADYQGRDEHLTPLGWLTGLEILAQTAETELRGPVLRVPARSLVVVCAVANVLLFSIIFRRFSSAASIPAGLVLAVLLSLSSSWIVFGRLAQAPYFGLFLVVEWAYKVNQVYLSRWKKTLEKAGELVP